MSKTLHTTQLLLDVDQSIDHSLDGLFVELHLNAFDACGRKKIQRFATEVTHANINAELQFGGTCDSADVCRGILEPDLAHDLRKESQPSGHGININFMIVWIKSTEMWY